MGSGASKKKNFLEILKEEKQAQKEEILRLQEEKIQQQRQKAIEKI